MLELERLPVPDRALSTGDIERVRALERLAACILQSDCELELLLGIDYRALITIDDDGLGHGEAARLDLGGGSVRLDRRVIAELDRRLVGNGVRADHGIGVDLCLEGTSPFPPAGTFLRVHVSL